MHKPTALLLALLCSYIAFSQKTDTLIILYNTDQYRVSKEDKVRIDSFIQKGWDRYEINGFTDEVDDADYNNDLSKKRSSEVFKYFLLKKIDTTKFFSKYFGETRPRADNFSENGRALNRRTEIIGYRFLKPVMKAAKPPADPTKPVTQTLDNGFIITYRPAEISEEWLYDMVSKVQLITNTEQMRRYNFFNNTTNGEILSSVLIVCPGAPKPCKLDKPIQIKIPIPFQTKCPVSKVKFFNAVAEEGRRIWQEESKELFPEIINGRQYISLMMDDFCQCINFDIIINDPMDPECFDIDSTKILYVNAQIKNLNAELVGLNCVYIPRKINDTTHSLVYLKISFIQQLSVSHCTTGKNESAVFITSKCPRFLIMRKTGNIFFLPVIIISHFPN